jgi:hypothetical protein
MIRITFIVLAFSFSFQSAFAQESINKNDALFLFRPFVFVDYNLYHRYQQPSISAIGESVGQVFNVLPGLGGGFIFGKKTIFMFSVEAAVKYLPFSLDIEGFDGMGSLAFPLVANFRIPVEGLFFFQIGGGVQFNQINIHRSINPSSFNPYFMTFIGEVAVGVEENLFLMYFLRFGFNNNSAYSFDFGLKFGLNGSLWE